MRYLVTCPLLTLRPSRYTEHCYVETANVAALRVAGPEDVGGSGFARNRQPGEPDGDDMFRTGLGQHQLQPLRRRRREDGQGTRSHTRVSSRVCLKDDMQ